MADAAVHADVLPDPLFLIPGLVLLTVGLLATPAVLLSGHGDWTGIPGPTSSTPPAWPP